jgi:hypothetical protein
MPAEPVKRPRSPRPRPTKAEPGRESTAESAARSTKARTGIRRGPQRDVEQPRVAAEPPPTDTRGVEIGPARLALRQAQLEALGIDDPGEGPIALRERWTFVPGAPSDSTARYDGQSCDQCGFPASSDAFSCPRCGYRRGGSSVMPPPQIASRPVPEGGTRGTALPETSGRPQPPRTL